MHKKKLPDTEKTAFRHLDARNAFALVSRIKGLEGEVRMKAIETVNLFAHDANVDVNQLTQYVDNTIQHVRELDEYGSKLIRPPKMVHF